MGDLNLTANFSRNEFKCKCNKCNYDTVDVETLMVLQNVADQFDAAVTINSGCRCLKYNKAVGGSENSYHLQGRASDIKVKGVSPYEVYTYLDNKYPGSYGLGKYSNFTHVDTRTGKARWMG